MAPLQVPATAKVFTALYQTVNFVQNYVTIGLLHIWNAVLGTVGKSRRGV